MKFKLVIGLGNDDAQYATTYHNVGHLFIDYIAERYPALRAEKSTGYMNEAGQAVQRAMKKNGASPKRTLIAHDESDLFLGEYKISTARGAAGHKGVQSVFDATGTNTFTRLRIGIRPQAKDQSGTNALRAKAETFVLKTISAANRKILTNIFKQAATELFGAQET